MPATTSDTTIANLALAKISAKAIVSLTDPTHEARWCARFYAQCRDEMLRTHPWNFAMKRADLTELVTPPVNEWAHQYALPADFISLYQLNSFRSDERPDLYQLEAGNLLTDEGAASIRYVFQQTDTTKYDPLFVKALSDLLASEICRPITGNDGAPFLQRYEQISLRRAQRADAREDKAKVKSPIATSDLVASRFFSTVG